MNEPVGHPLLDMQRVAETRRDQRVTRQQRQLPWLWLATLVLSLTGLLVGVLR